MHTLEAILLKEGGYWYPQTAGVRISDEDLVDAQAKAQHREGAGIVVKVKQLSVAFHGLRFTDGQEWDALNGWR